MECHYVSRLNFSQRLSKSNCSTSVVIYDESRNYTQINSQNRFVKPGRRIPPETTTPVNTIGFNSNILCNIPTQPRNAGRYVD